MVPSSRRRPCSLNARPCVAFAGGRRIFTSEQRLAQGTERTGGCAHPSAPAKSRPSMTDPTEVQGAHPGLPCPRVAGSDPGRTPAGTTSLLGFCYCPVLCPHSPVLRAPPRSHMRMVSLPHQETHDVRRLASGTLALGVLRLPARSGSRLQGTRHHPVSAASQRGHCRGDLLPGVCTPSRWPRQREQWGPVQLDPRL